MLPNTYIRRRTRDEVESEYTICDQRLGANPVIFGFRNKQWMVLVNQMQPGDEIWEYSLKQEAWDELMGEAGFALVREGKTICTVVTRMN
jgi:hypothetical protein